MSSEEQVMRVLLEIKEEIGTFKAEIKALHAKDTKQEECIKSMGEDVTALKAFKNKQGGVMAVISVIGAFLTTIIINLFKK